MKVNLSQRRPATYGSRNKIFSFLINNKVHEHLVRVTSDSEKLRKQIKQQEHVSVFVERKCESSSGKPLAAKLATGTDKFQSNVRDKTFRIDQDSFHVISLIFEQQSDLRVQCEHFQIYHEVRF